VKAEQAYRRGNVQVVWPSWLNDSICSWVRQGEAAYLIPRNTELSLLPPEAQDLAQSTMSEVPPDDQQMMDNLAHMDWGEAEDEVDAFLDEDDTETENDPLLGSGLTEYATIPDTDPLPAPKQSHRRPCRHGDAPQTCVPMGRRNCGTVSWQRATTWRMMRNGEKRIVVHVPSRYRRTMPHHPNQRAAMITSSMI